MAFKAFGVLTLGTCFIADGRKWVKLPILEFEEEGQIINAHSRDLREAKSGFKVDVHLFDEARLVQVDPDGWVASWIREQPVDGAM